MANFAPVNPDSATGKAAELLAQVQKSLGLTPNMTKVMANSPTLLKSYLALSGAVSGGALPAGVRERLAISTAQLNGCEYCLSAHTYIGANIAKVDPAELDSARRGESNDAHVAALLRLSNDTAPYAGEVDEADAKSPRERRGTDEEISEVVDNPSNNSLTNNT